jgi:hypothetical protein
MPPDEKDRNIIDHAFSPEGPLYDGPTSKGRRKYDQTFWWVRVVKDVGFPIVAAWWVATRLLPAIEKLEVAQEKNTAVMRALVCHLEPSACGRILMQEEHKEPAPAPAEDGP